MSVCACACATVLLSVSCHIGQAALKAGVAKSMHTQACLRAAQDIFVDAHNAGFYINSYTTKVNPTMDNVLRRIMEGIRRLHSEWHQQDEAAQAAEKEDPTTSRQQAFRRSLQMLNRLDTSFRRASWKSGCEMLFPILFGHMSFQTHRCWCVFMRRTIWLAAEAWRRYYGQLKSAAPGSSTVAPQFQLYPAEES